MGSDETLRTAREVAERVLALLAMVGLTHRRHEVEPWVDYHGVDAFFSPKEAAFYAARDPSGREAIQFSWRAEAIVALLWALGALPEMPPLNEQFDVFVSKVLQQAVRDPEAFLDDAVLRPEHELLDMEEYLHHQHWRVRDRDLGFHVDQPGSDDPPVECLDAGVVQERRYAMSWVVGGDEPWDDVSLDT